MYDSIRHECGGNAHSVSPTLQHGWNQYCCGRCGDVFFRWLTDKLVLKNKAADQ